MADLVQTMKLHIKPDTADIPKFIELTERYAAACSAVSKYVFDNEFPLNFMKLQDNLYYTVRSEFGLKSQFAISALKTVTARYKTVKEQLYREPYKFRDEDGNRQYITRTLEWLWKPIVFRRPQADFVRGRDYSFVDNGTMLSLNTLGKRIKTAFDIPEHFEQYFDGTWEFGTGKLVELNGEWYFHIPMTKNASVEFNTDTVKHVVGVDRGLRFLYTAYDEKGKTSFASGKDIMERCAKYDAVRAELQSKGTRSAKRALKRISGRENRWMTDVNHRLSKTLCDTYGDGTLYVLEDLTGVSFVESSPDASKKRNHDLRSWTFYQFEQFLTYKAKASGSEVIRVPAQYTSQRCPKCGRIRKENRDHETHEYACDCCGYRSNDDRIGAMNLYELGTLYISGDSNPRFGPRKLN